MMGPKGTDLLAVTLDCVSLCTDRGGSVASDSFVGVAADVVRDGVVVSNDEVLLDNVSCDIDSVNSGVDELVG